MRCQLAGAYTTTSRLGSGRRVWHCVDRGSARTRVRLDHLEAPAQCLAQLRRARLRRERWLGGLAAEWELAVAARHEVLYEIGGAAFAHARECGAVAEVPRGRSERVGRPPVFALHRGSAPVFQQS